MLSVSLLGDFRLRYNEAPIASVDTPRLQSLLAYLVLHADSPQSRAHLAFLYWPDTTEAQARTNLRNLLHELRHALPDAEACIDANIQTIQWRPDSPIALDVADFYAALLAAEHAAGLNDPAAVRGALGQAVALYKGDLLPSCYDDWIIPERERLRQACLSALERLVLILEEQRDYDAAIRHAQRLLRLDPLHESTYRCLIRLHALSGDRAGALRVYHTCATILRRELDVQPSKTTRDAYEQLLGAEPRSLPAAPETTGFSRLVAREKEWAQLLQSWRAVAAGSEPHVVMLRGEAGIGKTRLVEELLRWADRQGILTASARCYAAEGQLAYAPIIAWLRARSLPPLEDVWLAEVARLLPEVLARRPDLPRPAALTEAWQRERLFDALGRAIIGANRPLLLAIDDLQWCDPDTLDWLHFFLRSNRSTPALIAGAYRPEEVGEGHPLLAWLQALRLAEQVTEVDLGPLDEAATGILATRVAGREVSGPVAKSLYRETEGNPLFVVETIRAGLPAERGEPGGSPGDVQPGDALADDLGLPPKVRFVLEARLAQVSPSTREMAGLAATIGREFSYKLLANASGRDEATLVRQLDELWQRRIVREHGADAYDFSHDKLREVAYRSMSAARRRLLHRLVAQALEALNASRLDPVSHQVAVHYERAGLPEQAVPYYLRAAGVSRRVYANEEAMALLRRGLALAESGGPGAAGGELHDELVALFWEGLGDLLALKAQHQAALQAFANAGERIAAVDRIGHARLHRKAGAAKEEQRLYAEALELCNRAEFALGEQPGEDDGLWWDEWLEVQVQKVWAHYWLAEWPEMEALLRKAEPVVQKRGGPASRMRFLWASILMRLRKYRYMVSDEMLADQREALAASLEVGSPKTTTECQFELGFLHLWRREFDAAGEYLRAGLELSETRGITRMRTLSLTYLTVLHRFEGRMDETRAYARRAEEAAVAANMPDYIAAARANEAWLAWRNHDLPAAEHLCQQALTLWRQSPLVYPFQSLALWPLAAVALAQSREDEAWAHARALLEPAQQRLPDELNAALEAAVSARAAGLDPTARYHLDRAMDLACEMGYL